MYFLYLFVPEGNSFSQQHKYKILKGRVLLLCHMFPLLVFFIYLFLFLLLLQLMLKPNEVDNYLDMCLRKSRLVLYYISLRFYWDGIQNTAACLMLTLSLKRCSEGLVWTVQFSSRSQNVCEKRNGQHRSLQWIDLVDPASGLGYIHKYCCYLETYSLT